MKKLLAIILSAVMIFALAACGESSSGASTETSAKSEAPAAAAKSETPATAAKSESAAPAEETKEGEWPSYTFATSIWGTGAYPLDIITNGNQRAAEAAGCKLDVGDCQFTAEKVVTNLQSQLTSNPDGADFFVVIEAAFPQLQKLLDDSQTIYVFDQNFPTSEEVMNAIANDPYFVGGCTCNPYAQGYIMGEMALEDGSKTAAMFGSNIGDFVQDQRKAGFQAAFEAGGGEILMTTYCADPSEATTKANDLIMATEGVDTIYCSGGDYLSAVAAIKSTDPSCTFTLYGVDVAPDLIDYVAEGVIQANNGGQQICGGIGICLMVNYLDGHPILDENGKAPIMDNLSSYTVTPENAEGFAKLYETGSCFLTDEDWQKLLYRYNPDVSYDTYKELLANYADMVYALAEAAE